MNNKVVYDRKNKKFLTEREYTLALKRENLENHYTTTCNGYKSIVYSRPSNYLIIVGSDHLPFGVAVESWLVFDKAEGQRFPLPSPFAMRNLEFAYDVFFGGTFRRLREEHFEYNGCVPLILEGIVVNREMFMLKVSRLKRRAPELF